MKYEDIRCQLEGGVGVISFNRPESSNSLRLQTLEELCSALDKFIADKEVKVIVLRGEGKHFSAGADFDFLENLSKIPATEVKENIYHYFQGAAKRLYGCEKPTIALVSGAAVTVACELALACDFRLVSPTAVFQESWITLGLMPPLGGLFLLPRMVGLGRAKEMVLRADRINAEKALAIGLASEIVETDVLDERGLSLASELSALSPLAYRSVKEALHRGLETTMDAEWSTNALNQSLLIGTDHFRKMVSVIRKKIQSRPGK